MPLTGEGAAPGWGKLSTPLPTQGLAQGHFRIGRSLDGKMVKNMAQ
jgi:hypothetical protein